MNKTELCKEIADESGLTLKDSERFFDSFMDIVVKALKKSEGIVLIGVPFPSQSAARESVAISKPGSQLRFRRRSR